ncbi:helix-turn-helix transcriptional regulator [Micromonospora sp. NPDC051296]|uniref:helix-turn-helix domain-containing protein n=1 Tax=Micromonospora sp. NPDC051296 TaxID=3155046 RepID=UPI00341FB829
MEDFGVMLRQHRKAAGWSLRKFAEQIAYDFGYLGQIERGERPPTAEVVAAYDRELAAGNALEAAFASRQAGDTDMRRRSILQAMGALAAVPATDRLVGWEALRHGLGVAVDVEWDEWAVLVADYGRGFYLQPHDQLMAQLGRDLTVLQHQLAVDRGNRRPMLLRVAAHLSVIIALGLVGSGQAAIARRWWRTAQRVADESGDADTRVLTRAWDVVNGCYDGRSPAALVALSEQVSLLDEPASAATCGLLAGRAQALSLAGRHGEAVDTVRRLADHVEALPVEVAEDVESLWGWPEHRLRHTESWVYTHAGLYDFASAAQERALKLYPVSQQRLRTQVQLHRAAALTQGGHIPDGLRLAADLLDRLPRDQHNELVRTLARKVAAAVPNRERARPMYGELMERVRV